MKGKLSFAGVLLFLFCACAALFAQGISVGTQEHGADVLVAFQGTGLRLRY